MTDRRQLSEWIVRATPDGLWVFDSEGRTLFANDRLAEMLGRTPQEMAGLSVFDCLDEMGGGQFRQHLAELDGAGESGHNLECSLLRSNGERFSALVSHTPLRDDAGEHRGWLHRVSEFTQQRRLLDQLQQREQQLAEAQAIARVGSWEWDIETDRVTWSDELYRIYGMDPSELEASYEGFIAGLHPDDRELVGSRVGEAMAGADGFEWDARIIRRNGTVAWIRGRGLVTRAEDGRPVRMGGTAQDITETKSAELSRAIVQSIATAANEATSLEQLVPLVLREVPRYTSWSPVAAFLTSGGGETLVPLTGSPGAAPLAREAVYAADLATRHTAEGSVWVAAPVLLDGRVVCVVVLDTRAGVEPTESEVSLISQLAAILSRVAEREQASRELARARDEAMSASVAAEAASTMKSEFLATMSHEIRTPLNGVIGLTELLSRTDLTEHQQRLTDGIDQAGRALLGLVNNVLDFSKIEAGHLDLETVDFDPRAIVEQAANIVAEQARTKGLELVVSFEPGLPLAVRGDPVRFGQVIANLASNAVKFTSAGEVVIRARPAEPRPTGPVVRVEVSDTGVGVAPEAQSRLFDAFTQADSSTTREYGGTGLGLAICRRIVTALDGQMGVQSEPGVGSTFWFTASFGPASAVLPSPAQAPLASLAGLRVLVVDDNSTNRFILTEQLATWRLTTAAAESAAEATAMLEEAHRRGRPFDIALLDYLMPDTDGLQLARRLREDPRHDQVRLVLLTSALGPLTDAGTVLPVDLVLTKPVLPSVLGPALARVFAADGAAIAAPRDAGARHATDRADVPGVATPGGAVPEDLTEGGERSLPGQPRGRVLVVEDNPVNQMVAEGILESLGYTTTLAANGAEGVSAFADDPGGVVAVLMDCQMPVMDGYDATRAIREMQRHDVTRVPVIAMTASAVTGERERCLDAGMDDFLTKPIDIALLEATLRHWVGRSGDPSAEFSQPDAAPGTTAPGTSAPAARVPSTPAPGPGGGVLDAARLGELLELDPDDPSLLLRFIDRFSDNARQTLAGMREAHGAGDRTALGRLAHSLKGSAANLGAPALAELCRAVEHASDDDQPLPPGTLDQVGREVERAAAALGRFAAGLRPGS
jgi:PAS domain S-box-containing protein